MKKEEVHPIPFVADAQPLLPTDEAEITAQLQKKSLQMPDRSRSIRP